MGVKLVTTYFASSPRRATTERNFARPLDFIFHIDAYHRVRKFIQIRGRGQDRCQIRIGNALGDGFVIAGVDIILVRAHTIFRPEKAVVDPIVAELQAERIFHLAAKPLAENRVARVKPRHPAPVLLFELIALNRVIQEVSEIGKQIEVVIKSVGRDFRLGICAAGDAIPTASYNAVTRHRRSGSVRRSNQPGAWRQRGFDRSSAMFHGKRGP